MFTRQSSQQLRILRRLLLIACIFLSNPCPAKTLYVDDDAPAGGDGLHWTSAFCYLQDALAAAEPNDEIRVAQGRYCPDRGENLAAGDRSATFELRFGVALLGGYGGLSAEDPNQRDADQYASVLSGDLLDNDNQGAGLLEDNNLLIMTATEVEGEIVLDGFIIQGGNGEGGWYEGTGVSIVGGQVLIQNCRFEGGGHGTALWIARADSRVIDCVFARNTEVALVLLSNKSVVSVLQRCVFKENTLAVRPGAAPYRYGGAGNPLFLDCMFLNNRLAVGQLGGGGGSPTFRHCQFINNHGGAVSLAQHNIAPVFHGCLFAGNQTTYRGGALYLMHTRPLIEYCTFVNNQAEEKGGAIYSEGETHIALSNSILWYNRATEGPQIYLEEGREGLSSLNATYCNIEGGLLDVALTGPVPTVWQHNLGDDLSNHIPGFVDPGSWQGQTFILGDYHLKSQAGHWDETTQNWIQDAVTSPCIDAGNPMSPIGFEPFPNGGRVNMGAYGGTDEASKSYFGKPICETIVAGDLNGDCRVDYIDFAIMSLHWLECHDVDY